MSCAIGCIIKVDYTTIEFLIFKNFQSGTVGNPKGVMMSHDNLYYEARAIALALGVKEAEENVVSYLPLSHIAAQV